MSQNFLTGTSNADYHADRSHLSSSGLKLLLASPEQFYAEYVLGQRAQGDSPAFAEGTLVHSLILEPHLVEGEYAIFPGLRKSGKLWELFQAEHAGRKIVSAAQMLRCEALARSYQNTRLAVELVSGGHSEHSMVSEILGVPVKARADYININKRYIVDVKTTSSPTGTDFFKETIKQYSYDLSAALYCQIAHDTYKSLFDFYWLVLSKADQMCRVYKASSATLSGGAAQVTQALVTYKKCRETGIWQHPDFSSFKTGEEVEVI